MGCPSTSAIPSNEWFTTDQAGWDFVIAGRTGGNGGQAYIDDVTLTATIITPDGIVDGTAGDDLITTGYVDAQGDTFNGPGGLANMIMAGDGNDTITGDAANNILDGGTGNGVISCSGGSDRIFGGEGNDTVDGGAGRDTLYGGAGNDNLIGNSGDDLSMAMTATIYCSADRAMTRCLAAIAIWSCHRNTGFFCSKPTVAGTRCCTAPYI